MTSKDDEIRLYDVVRIKTLRHSIDVEPDAFNITEWLDAFAPEDIELEKVA